MTQWVSQSVSQSVSEWQGHLLSCSGQLKSSQGNTLKVLTYQNRNQVGALIDSVRFSSGFETHLSSECFLCKWKTVTRIRTTYNKGLNRIVSNFCLQCLHIWKMNKMLLFGDRSHTSFLILIVSRLLPIWGFPFAVIAQHLPKVPKSLLSLVKSLSLIKLTKLTLFHRKSKNFVSPSLTVALRNLCRRRFRNTDLDFPLRTLYLKNLSTIST